MNRFVDKRGRPVAVDTETGKWVVTGDGDTPQTCTPEWHVWDKRQKEGRLPTNGERCSCGDATWP